MNADTPLIHTLFIAPSESVSRGFNCFNFPLPSPFACAVNKSPPPLPPRCYFQTRLTAVNRLAILLTGWLAMLKRVKIDRESLVHINTKRLTFEHFQFPPIRTHFLPFARRGRGKMVGCSSSLVSLRGFRTECRGGEIKPEPRPDLPPLGVFKFFSGFYMGVPLSPGEKNALLPSPH